MTHVEASVLEDGGVVAPAWLGQVYGPGGQGDTELLEAKASLWFTPALWGSSVKGGSN